MSDTADDLRYLSTNIGWLAHQPVALVAFDELAHIAAVLVESAIRQPRIAFWYAGPCDTCKRDLYARYGETEVACPACELVYDVEDRRAWLLTVVEDCLERAVVICRALSAFGHDVSRHRLGMWQTRGLIAPRAHDPKGYPLYRVGDVLDLLGRLDQKAS